MKKLFALLLALVLVLSLAACGGNSGKPPDGGNDTPGTSQQEQNTPAPDEGEDEPYTSTTNEDYYMGYEISQEFTIYVNGSEEWTPFPGKSDILFVVDDEEIVSISDDGTTVHFTGEQVGETILGARVDERDLFALVRVRAMESAEKIDYRYIPPTDNYYIVFENVKNDGGTTEEMIAKIGRKCMYSYDTSYSYRFADFENKKAYDGFGGQWEEDFHSGLLEEESDYSDAPLPLSAMEEYFIDIFKVTVDDMDRLNEYYVGSETLYPAPYENSGIKCWIFDAKGLNDINMKFWIDPSNGCCLKYEDYKDGESTVVTEYNLNYTAWDNAPQ